MPCGYDDDGFQEAMDFELNAGFDYMGEAYRATSDDALHMAAAEAADEAKFRFYLDFWGSEYGPYTNPGMRFAPGYRTPVPAENALDWSNWGGFSGGGTMCPSYRATKDEKHLTRGRANILRLAIAGQLGPDAFTSEDMKETLDLCVSCKGCKRDCPTGVDIARMKIEFLHHYHARHGLPLKEKLIAYLPRYAPIAAKLAPLMNLRDRIPLLAKLSERFLGFSARRTLPVWRKPWAQSGRAAAPSDVRGDGRNVVLFGDTFNRYYERKNPEATEVVLKAGGFRIHGVEPADGGRPLC